MRRLGQILVALAALLDFASAWMHGTLARRAVLGRLPSSVPPDTVAGLNAAWILGTLAMVTFGVLALAGLGSIGRDRGAARVPLVSGVFFLLYGAWGYLYRHHPHFIGFMAIGALFIAGAFFSARERVTS